AAGGRTRSERTPSAGARTKWMLVATVPLFIFALRSLSETMAMQAFSTGERLSRVQRAAALDPGSYRIQLRLAVLELNSNGCRTALPHARRAAAMLPAAYVPRSIIRRCGG
ncbi:MAG TPA: hypothetical protein VIG47_01345, partial [Gemmatimonadaceae bacterium]